jgi:hypothetical protein
MKMNVRIHDEAFANVNVLPHPSIYLYIHPTYIDARNSNNHTMIAAKKEELLKGA